MRDPILEDLWDSAPKATLRFAPAMVEAYPPAARRYLLHALAPGALLATAMRVRMHGELRMGDVWHDFTAEQVLRWDRGFVWRASTRMKGLPVSGFDRLVDGSGLMRWKMLGLVLVMSADGPDISRSAAGRLHAEATWMPGVLVGDDVYWAGGDDTHAKAVIRAHGELSELELTLGPDGARAATPTGSFAVPAMKVDPVDTVGAGDTFCGYLAAGLDQGLDLEAAMRRAAVAASLAVLKPGAQPAVPYLADVVKAIG